MIPPLGATGAIPSFSPVQGLSATSATGGATSGGSGFAQVLGSAIDALQSSQQTANTAAQQAAVGQGSVANLITATTEAQLAVGLTVAVRNEAVASFNQIMSMPL
jgi:flagellar hook-basal body complex protein FliE